MQVEAEEQAFGPHSLLIATAGSVHGFAFEPETQGHVLTLSAAYLHELMARLPECRPLFDAPRAVDSTPERFESCSFAGDLERLGRELVWAAPGRSLAVEGRLLCILAGATRIAASPAPLAAVSARAGLVARFREAIEQRFRSGQPLDAYAGGLGVTASRLRAACLAVAGASPMKLVHDRLMVEAKRMLLYTNMSVAEVGYDLGFEDPAYFTRFFTEREGRSPTTFRNGSQNIAFGSAARSSGRT